MYVSRRGRAEEYSMTEGLKRRGREGSVSVKEEKEEDLMKAGIWKEGESGEEKKRRK
jgi:hypothetical protein